MKVIFYGKLAESISRQVEFDRPTACTVAEMRVELDRAFPGAGLANTRVRACVAGTIVSDDTMLRPDQVVEILAPVSGG